MVDVEYVETFPNLVSLEEIKNTSSLKDMALVKRGRLSVQPATKKEFDLVVKMARKRPR